MCLFLIYNINLYPKHVILKTNSLKKIYLQVFTLNIKYNGQYENITVNINIIESI